MVKNKDPNGVDLYYFNSTEEFTKCRRSTVLAKSVAAKTFEGVTTPETKLKGLLVKYCVKLKEYTIKRNAYEHRGPASVRSLLPFGRPPTLPRALSVYVLTDGVWESPDREGGDYLTETIRKLVEQLKEAGCGRRAIHPFRGRLVWQAAARSVGYVEQEPWSGLVSIPWLICEYARKLADGSRDIVDTEPVDKDNVWKMLLGPINSQFDADWVGLHVVCILMMMMGSPCDLKSSGLQVAVGRDMYQFA
jgi:hypothetical protein